MTASAVDWDLAGRIAGRLSRPGPRASAEERRGIVADLRHGAALAVGHVARTAQLAPATNTEVLVVDRPGWASSALTGMSQLVGSALPTTSAAAAQAAAVEVGALMAVLSSRVLGQFDPWVTGSGRGRLVLVAPTVMAVERALKLDPTPFRTWVCLHEQTHATQFAAAPWLARYLAEQARALTSSIMAGEAVKFRFRGTIEGLIKAVRSADAPTLLELVATPEELAALDSITAVMSLLEGHADVVMDAVGPDVVPGVAQIRRAFDKRRTAEARPGLDWAVRRLLGLDAKMAQYRDGADFVRAVQRRVGVSGFNAIWTSAEQLPTISEIADPHAWVRRVHG